MRVNPTNIIVVGYGNQGRAWAANLRDSGFSVRVSGRSNGHSLQAAAADGFITVPAEKLQDEQGLLALLLPDEAIPEFFARYLKRPEGEKHEALPPRAFLFAHGFSVVYGNIPFSPSDLVLLVAPKGIGVKLRENYQKGSGVMGVIGAHNPSDPATLASSSTITKDEEGLARAVAKGLGCDRVGILVSSFAEETKADLLSEQAILCGSVPRLVDASVRFLVEKGVDPKLATYECLHELKLIVDMMVAKGIHGMLDNVSTAAKFGGLRAGEILLPEAELQQRLELLWKNIEEGSFAKDLYQDRKTGSLELKKRLAQYENSPADRNL